MNKLKLALTSLLATCLFFVAGGVNAQVNAATISVSASPSTVTVNNDTQVTVSVNAGTTQIFGAQATINFPADAFTVKSIIYGNYFTDNVQPVQNSGQIILQGSFFSSITGTGSGNGTFATITLTAKKAAGTGIVNFGCDGGYRDTYILDSAGGNILACSSLNSSTVNFSEGTSPTATPAPGGGNPPTNACGGTCGSVYNCNANLFCYQGYCRNPDCPSSTTCGCPTITPSPKPTNRSTPKPTAKSGATATPVVVALSTFTPFPSFTPISLATAVPGTGSGTLAIKPIYVWIGLGVLALVVIIIMINALRRKSPPKFTPPTNVPPMFPTNPPVTPPPPSTY